MSLIIQVAAEIVIGMIVFATIMLGRSWIPATQILARRMHAAPGQNLIRAAWTTLR